MAGFIPKIEVKFGRVGGLLYKGKNNRKPVLVLFNQWRSGANSILSKYIAKLVLEHSNYSAILFIDRIASGGVSDNTLSTMERKKMRSEGEFQFGRAYVDAIRAIALRQNLNSNFVIGGSSAGAPAALAAVRAMDKAERKQVVRIVLVEPGGLRTHGIGNNNFASVVHAFGRQAWAYRHRLSRGWWTPMDKEQYFAKGKLSEYRARWLAHNFVFHELCKALANPKFPPINLVLSTTSHIHNKEIRNALNDSVLPPHQIIKVTGNHDRLCQPPSLSEFYLDAATTKSAVSSKSTSK